LARQVTKNNSTSSLSYTGVSTALALLSVIVGGFFPFFNLLPQIICPLCFYIVFVKAGWVYGLMGIVSCGILSFFLLGANLVPIVEYIVLVAPYSILVYLLRSFDYSKKKVSVRIIFLCIFALLSGTALLIFAQTIMPEILETSFFGVQLNGIAFYVVTYVLFVMTTLLVDYVYTKAGSLIYPKILKNDKQKERDKFDIFN
jgi:hypothetical protein